MPDGFIVGGKIQLEAPTNLKAIAANIQKELGNISAGVDINIRRGATTQIATMSRNLERLNTVLATTTTQATSAANAINRLADGFNGVLNSSRTFAQSMSQIATHTKEIKNVTTEASDRLASFGRNAELSAKRFLAFGLAAGTIIKFTQAIREGVSEAVSFQREMVRLAQVSTDPAASIREVETTISKLSVSLGVASRELVDVAVTFKQAGLSINDTKVALEAVAEASLAPTFTNTKNTVEGSIAALQQFKLSANELKGVLGSINQVSADFAVESNDLVTAIQKSGGAFKAAGGEISELLAVFTSVRQTTRESADTIATGLRTIFARLQRPQTLEDLKQFGIVLRNTREEAIALGNVDLTNQFVGPFEALKRISEALRGVEGTDPRFAQIVESIGGLRQLSKVVPAIQQFAVAQDALNSALGGTGSLTRSTIQAQDALIIQVTKVREQYNTLFRDLINSKAFTSVASGVLTLASSFAILIDAVKPLLPLLTALAAVKLSTSIGGILSGFKDVPVVANIGKFLTGKLQTEPIKRQRGGFVPGSGNGDTVPALLEPGEFVLSNPAVDSIGRDKVANLHKMAAGGFPRAEFNKLKDGKFVNHTLGAYPDSLLSKVPVGSTYLASGTEAMVLKTPQGTVVRLGKISEERDPAFFRPNAGEVLQPLDSQKEGEFVFEELPFAPALPKSGLSNKRQQMAINGLAKRILTSGLLPTDLSPDNVGLARDDKGKPRIKIIDPATFSAPRNEEEEGRFKNLKKRFGLFANGGSADLTRNLGLLSSSLEEPSLSINLEHRNRFFGGSKNRREYDKETVSQRAASHAKFSGFDTDPGKAISFFEERARLNKDLLAQDEIDEVTANRREIALTKRKNAATKLITQSLAESVGLDKDADTFAIHDLMLEKGRHDEVDALKKHGLFAGFAKGGSVSDRIPAMLTPGEYVINAEDAAKLGDSRLNALNRGKIPGFAKGGWVGMATGGEGVPPNDPNDDIVNQIIRVLGSKTAQTSEREAYLQAKIKQFENVDFDSLESNGGQAFNVGTIEEFEQLLKDAGRTKKQIQEYLKALSAKFSDVNEEVSQLTVSLGTGDAATVNVLGARKDLTENDKILSDPRNRQSPADAAALRKARFEAAAKAAREAKIEQATGGILGDTSNITLRPLNPGRGSRRIPSISETLASLPAGDENDNRGLLDSNARRLGSGIGIIPDDLEFENPLKQTIIPAITKFTNGISDDLKLQPLTPPTPTNFVDAEARGTPGPGFARNPLVQQLTGPASEKNFNGGPVEVAINRIPQLFDAIGRGVPQATELQKALLAMNPALSATSKVVLDINRETQAVTVLRGVPNKITPLNGQFDTPRGNNNVAFTDAVNTPETERRAERIQQLREATRKPDLDARVKDILEGVQLQPLNPKAGPLDAPSISQIIALEQARKAERNTAKGRSLLSGSGEEDLQPLPPPPPPKPPIPPSRISLPVVNNPPNTTVFNSLSELENILVRLGKTAPEIADFTGSLRKFGVAVDQAASGVLKLGTRADGKPTAQILTAGGRALESQPQVKSFREQIKDFGGSIANFFGKGTNLTDEQRQARSGRIGNAAIVGSLALPFVGQAFDPGKATAESGAGFQAASGFTGGLQGAAFGAGIAGTLGLSILPLTIAAAGVGIVTALKDAEKAINQAKLDEAVLNLSKQLNNAQILGNNNTLGTITSSIDDINKQADKTGASNAGFFFTGRGLQEERKKARTLSLGAVSSQLNSSVFKAADTLGTQNVLTGKPEDRRAQADKLLDTKGSLAPIIESLATANNVSTQAITKQLQDVVIKASLAADRERTSTSAAKANDRGVTAISLFTNSLLSAARAADKFQKNLDFFQQLNTGNIGAIAPISQNEKIQSFGLPNNNEFASGVDTVLAPFGDFGRGIADTAKSFDIVSKVLPVAINNLNRKGLGANEDVGAGLQDELKLLLGKNAGDGVNNVISILADKIGKLNPEEISKRGGVDVSGFADSLIKDGAGQFLGALGDLTKAFDSEKQRVAQNLAQFRQLQEQYNQGLEKIADAQNEAARTEAEIQGRRTGENPLDLFSRDQARRPFNEAQARLLQGTGLGNEDAAGIGAALSRARDELTTKRNDGKTGQQELDTLAGTANNLGQALNNLTNISRRAGDIQDRLNNLRSQEQARGSIVSRLFSGDARTKQDTVRGLSLANQFQNADDKAAFAIGLNPKDRTLLESGLRDAGGANGQNLEKLLFKAVAPGVFRDNEEQQRGLEGELKNIQSQAVAAQVANTTALGNLKDSFKITMEQSFATNAQLLAKGLEDLTNQFKLQKTGERASAEGQLNKALPLLESGFSLTELQSLKASSKTSKFVELEKQRTDLNNVNVNQLDFQRKKGDPNFEQPRRFDLNKVESEINRILPPDLAKKFLEQNSSRFNETSNTEAGFKQDQLNLKLELQKFIDEQKPKIVEEQAKIGLTDKEKTGLRNPEFVKALNETDLSKLSSAGTTLLSGAEKFVGTVDQFRTIISSLEVGVGNEKLPGFIGPPQTLAGGGSIFKPKGTDTVPAMLTPGEFVINAEATRKNIGLLHQINDGYANGGVVYARRGRRIFGGSQRVTPQAVVQQVAALPPAAKKAVAEQLGMPTEQTDLGLGGGNFTTFDTLLGGGNAPASFGTEANNPRTIYRADGGFADFLERRKKGLTRGNVAVLPGTPVDPDINPFAVPPEEAIDNPFKIPEVPVDNPFRILSEKERVVADAKAAAEQNNKLFALQQSVLGNTRASTRNLQNAQTAAALGNSEFVGQAAARGNNLRDLGLQFQNNLNTAREEISNDQRIFGTGKPKTTGGGYAAAFRVSARYKALGRSGVQGSTLIGGKVAPGLTTSQEANAIREREGRTALDLSDIDKFRANRAAGLTRGQVITRAGGGIVPAYLHNGEFVVNKQSTSRNVDLLSNINNNPKHFAQGGPVGSVSPSGGGNSPVFNFDQLNTASEVLQASIRTFAESSSKLSQALSAFPAQIALEGKHTVEVIVNGTQALQEILPEVSQLIAKETKSQINKLLQNKFPDAGQEL